MELVVLTRQLHGDRAMLVSVYYPFADERVLFPSRSALVQSRFSKLDEPHRFYRNLGDIIDRPSGGFLGWIGESSLCAVRSINIELKKSDNKKQRIAFKRMFFDGLLGGYFSIGISLDGPAVDQAADGAALVGLLCDLANLSLKSSHRPSDSTKLAAYGKLAADIYASGSLRGLKGLMSADYRKNVAAGPPIIIVSLRRKDMGTYGSFGERLRIGMRSPIRVSALDQETFGWFINWQQEKPTFVFVIASQTTSDLANSRFLRAGVARLYLEMFVLERLISLLQSPLFEQCDQEGRDIICESINRALRRLHGADRPTIGGTDESYNALVGTFAKIFKPGHVAQLDDILTRLKARPNLRRAIERSYLVDQEAATVAISIGGDFVVGNKTVQTGGISVTNAKVIGDIFEGNKTIDNSTNNTTTNISYVEQVRNSLEPIAAAIEQAPVNKAEAKAKLEQLKDEASKGRKADDGVMSTLLKGLVGLVPTAITAVATAFGSPILGAIAGPATKAVIDAM